MQNVNDIIFVLGASDPEMKEIQEVLTDLGITFVFAQHGGYRVHPKVMYEANVPTFRPEVKLVLVECGFAEEPHNEVLHLIDHHREGDPGYGRPPESFWEASSLGQTFNFLQGLGLDVKPTADHYYAAAADHCLGAAYQGKCPGIDPEGLGEWRLRSRSEYQGIDYDEMKKNVVKAMVEIENSIEINLNDQVKVYDMRREKPVKELPEAAMRLGISYISGPIEVHGGREKYTASGSPETVRAFMEEWAVKEGFEDIYGDPMRGFAGAYLPL